MHVRMAAVCVSLGFLAGSATPSARAFESPSSEPPVTRFAQVGPRLYRGGQPDARGFAYLKDLDIRTVISLRDDNEGERKLVESLGMAFHQIPVVFPPLGFSGSDMPDAAVKRFFELVDSPTTGKVFVHCKRGADRTGAFVALYRITRQDWSLERAYDEARSIGMRWWYSPVKDRLAVLARAFRPSIAGTEQ